MSSQTIHHAHLTAIAYEHDCDACVFLGITIGGGKLVDLYYHPHSGLDVAVGNVATVIARYSSEPADYCSCPIGMARPGGHAELWAARSLYEEKHG